MDKGKRHKKLWPILHCLICPVIKKKMHYSCKKVTLPGPSLVVSNHVTNMDPFLVAAAFPKDQMYFVASEHLFRKGFLTKIIQYLVGPIARRKGSSGGDAAMAMMRALKKDHSVCVFAEGETSWNGINHPLFPGTGDIAKLSNVSLVTFRLQGGYLTAPRWGKGVRKGKMQGGIVHIYSPEQLQNMSSADIAKVLEQDLYENAWERQKEEHIPYKGKNRAKYIETALFLCPKCHQWNTLEGKGNQVTCACGLNLTYTEYGYFEPKEPFETLLEWDQWQHEELKKAETLPSFRDEDVSLVQLMNDHTEKKITEGALSLFTDSLRIHSHCFPLTAITQMALVKKTILVFSCYGNYYEVRGSKPLCLRKYLAVWNNSKEQKE